MMTCTSTIEQLTHINYLSWILTLFIIMFATKEIIDIFSYFKSKLHLKTVIDEDKENVENRLSILEKHDNWQYQEILKISSGIDNISNSLLQKEIQDLRWELLDFCSALTNGRKYNQEAFKHIFRTYEDYEKLLSENGMTNGYVEESMNVVREIYHQKLIDGEFK